MNWNRLVNMIADQPWVDTAAKSVQKAVETTYKVAGPVSQPLQNLLHGTWLGHPLHPVLTDLPIGAWTAVAALDALELAANNKKLRAGADTALAVGLGGAATAALAGLTDWYQLRGKSRRVGMLHMMMNTGAATLYTASLVARKSDQRRIGQALAYGGFGLVAAGAYLGGHLVFTKQVGVDHTADLPKNKKYREVMLESKLAEGSLQQVAVNGVDVVLARSNGHIYALADTCSHMGCSLAQGELVGESIRCNCHGSRFALEDGRVLDGPSTYWQPVYEVRLQNGSIEVGKQKSADG